MVTAVYGATILGSGIPGAAVRAQFGFGSTTTITISSSSYHHDGSTEQVMEVNSLVTFTPGSGGSNAGSTDLGASQTHYVFIDDSAVVTKGTNVLAAAQFINTIVAPTWSEAKHGWYTGNDRCIFSFTTTGANAIVEFFHDGGDYVTFADQVEDLAATDIDTTFTDVTLSIPGFSKRAIVHSYVTVNIDIFFWRTNGQTGAAGKWLVIGDAIEANSTTVITDSSQIIEVKANNSDTSQLTINTAGWYFPRGM